MKKRILSLLIVITLILSFSAPVLASDLLEATGSIGTANEARVVIQVIEGSTLGDLETISWSEYLNEGYPPHVDVIIDTGGGTDALVFEYAYNDDSHYYTEGPMPYGALTDAWYQTFSDDGNGPAVITDTSYAWLSSGAPGPYPSGAGFVGGTLAEWKAGTADASIDASTPILRLEIEVDNWVVDCSAIVDNIQSNIKFVPPEYESPAVVTLKTYAGEVAVGMLGCDSKATMKFVEGWRGGKTLRDGVHLKGEAKGVEYELVIDAGTQLTYAWNPYVMATYLWIDIDADGELFVRPKNMLFSKPATLTINGEIITFTEIKDGKLI